MESPTAVYKGNKHLELYAQFITLSQELRGVQFVYYDSEEYDTQMGQLPSTRIMVHRGDQASFKADVYEGKSYVELRDFIIKKAYPFVVESNPKTLSLVLETEVPALFLHCPDRLKCQPFIEVLNKTDTSNHTMLKLVAFHDSSVHDNDKHHGEKEYKPHLSIMDARRGHLHHHHMHHSLTPDHVEKFILWFFGHRKSLTHFSEHADCHKHQTVRRVTGHSYHRDIYHTHKLTILLVYTSSADHTQLLQTYEAAAEQIARRFSRHIKFRRLDQEANMTPLKFYSKPTFLIIFPTTSRTPEALTEVEATTERLSPQQLADMITSHAHMSLDGFDAQDALQSPQPPIDLDL